MWPSKLGMRWLGVGTSGAEHEEGGALEEEEEAENELAHRGGGDGRKEREKMFEDAMKDEPELIHKMLSELASLDSNDVTMMLGWAAYTGQPPAVISKIGEQCTDLSASAFKGDPALHLAVSKGHVLVVQELLRIGADVNGTCSHGVLNLALHRAVNTPSLACVKALLGHADIEVDALSSSGDTALGLCVIASREQKKDVEEKVFADIAAALIARGANIHKKSRDGSEEDETLTALGEAIAYDKRLIVAEMLRLGERPPAPVVTSYIEHVKSMAEYKVMGMLEVFVEVGWCTREPGNARTTAAAGSRQRPSENRAPSRSYPLHDAVRSGNVSKLAELLSWGQDVNAVDAAGCTALHLAATSGNDEVVGALVRAKGIRVDKLNKDKVTALYRAAQADKAGAVKALLEANASRDLKDAKGVSVMHEVAKRPAGAVIEALIAAGVSPGQGGEKGLTPLHTACRVDARGTVEALLRGGALAGHCWNDMLQSPLMVACKHGHLNAVQQLLPRLSLRQINMRSSFSTNSETALVAAINCPDVKMEMVSIVEALLAAGADSHIRAGPGNMPALATALGSTTEAPRSSLVATDPVVGPPLVRALVAAGADVKGMTITLGYTALQIACLEGACAEVLQALLDVGADPFEPCAGAAFMSPVELAALNGGDPRAVRLLIELPNSGGLNALGSSPDRLTALSAAVQTGQTEVVRYLLEEGADMDLLPFNDDGTQVEESLIEMAASWGHLDTMNLLIQATMFRDKAAEQQQQQQQQVGRDGKGEAEETALC